MLTVQRDENGDADVLYSNWPEPSRYTTLCKAKDREMSYLADLLQPQSRRSMLLSDLNARGLRKSTSRSGFTDMMETISENAAETETEPLSKPEDDDPPTPTNSQERAGPIPSPSPGVSPSSRPPFSTKSSRSGMRRSAKDVASHESFPGVYRTYSAEERSIAEAMRTWLQLATAGEDPGTSPRTKSRESFPERTPTAAPPSRQESFTSIDLSSTNPGTHNYTPELRDFHHGHNYSHIHSTEPLRVLPLLPDIDPSKSFVSFGPAASTSPVQSRMLSSEPIYPVRAFPLAGAGVRYILSSKDSRRPLPLVGMGDAQELRELSSVGDKRPAPGKASGDDGNENDDDNASTTDSGVQADEDTLHPERHPGRHPSRGGGGGIEFPHTATLTHDEMIVLMGATPLHQAIYKWHIEERVFTRDLTAFSCDPRTDKAVGFLPEPYRRGFARLCNPLAAFGYEVQRYCMRYLPGYDMSAQIRRLQHNRSGRGDAGLEDSGIGSDVGSRRSCGCDSGRSCSKAGSSKQAGRASSVGSGHSVGSRERMKGDPQRGAAPTPPPRLRIPLIESRDGEQDNLLTGLGIMNPPPPAPEPVPALALAPAPSPSMDSTERSSGPPPTPSLRRKATQPSLASLATLTGEGSPSDTGEATPSQPTTATNPSPAQPLEKNPSKRKRRCCRIPDDCPRLPRLDLAVSDEMHSLSDGTPSLRRSSGSITGSALAGSNNSRSSRESTASTRSVAFPIRGHAPLTIEEETILVVALHTTMYALVDMRDFMVELDGVNSILKVPRMQCPMETYTAAEQRLYLELLPQCDDRISRTVSLLEEQADVFGAVLDGPSSPPPEEEVVVGERVGDDDDGDSDVKRASACTAVSVRGTSAWARATALERAMTGGLPARWGRPAPRGAAGRSGTGFFARRLEDHALLRPLARLDGACTRARFHALQHLARFPFLDRFTFWSLTRLEGQLEDRLQLRLDSADDGTEAADATGALWAMRYTVSSMAADIIARRGRMAGIADAEERASVDPAARVEERVGKMMGQMGGQYGWASQVMGLRGRRNAANRDDGMHLLPEGQATSKDKGKEKETFPV